MSHGKDQDRDEWAGDRRPAVPFSADSRDEFESHAEQFDETVAEDPTKQAAAPQLPSTVAASAGPSHQAMPERVGRYELKQILGQGGFGSVYLGHDPQLNRQVAVKVPHLNSRASAGEDEFLKEARQLAQLNHPG